ncbi:hypothetical protein CQ14_06900 [Bradyrhizobium lablabi]|uniref:Uncharacterized protein n=2 Tax=Bradyrhizobium lablabi TaxID=722472 RepID=A0A0R3MNN8_9BRAD|nr:hypothetical protein CQ14_06900 [Bradyrhizobium lablabi]
MFPSSGVPATDAHNTILDPNTVNCDDLWYSTTRCQPRFDPAAANATLSELINLVNCAGIPYDCTKFDNLCRAVRYLTKMYCAPLTGGPAAYGAVFDPPLLELPDDCCTHFTVIPNVENNGAVTINLHPVLRNDLQELRPGDFTAGIPIELIWCNGKFVVPYMVRSQTPVEFKGQLDYWVRPDGSDATGDGTANSPSKAFRTINYAFQTAMSRYVRSPEMILNIRLGIPGDYEGARIYKFPGIINIIGDIVAPAGYRIHCSTGADGGVCIFAEGSTVHTRGVNLILDAQSTLTGTGPIGVFAYRNAVMSFSHGRAELNINGHAISSGFFESGGGVLHISEGSVVVDGKGRQIAHGMGSQANAGFTGCTGAVTPNQLTITWINCNFIVAAYWAYALAGVGVSNDVISGVPVVTVVDSGCVGPEYNATVNAFVYGGGKVIPGATAGSVGSGGVFQP